MYSKNDYRYYLENRLAHSDDYLAHYGVKGMKWKQHLKNKYDVYSVNGHQGIAGGNIPSKNVYGYDFREAGIESRKNPNKYVAVGSKKYDNGRKSVDLYTGPSKKERSIKKGRVSIDTGSEGSHISIDTTKKKKKTTKQKVRGLRRKYGLYSIKPSGRKLKGSSNIYVSHN